MSFALITGYLTIALAVKEPGVNPLHFHHNPTMSKKQIQTKLAKLSKLIDQIDQAHLINSEDPDTWDSDALYNLVENLKDTLKLLEDQPIKGKVDEFGQPLYEDGLCSLVDEYHEDHE